jgi:hypothetical protein
MEHSIANEINGVILAWAYFALAVMVIFGVIWLAVMKPWDKSEH